MELIFYFYLSTRNGDVLKINKDAMDNSNLQKKKKIMTQICFLVSCPKLN